MTDEMSVTWMTISVFGANEQNPSKNEECTVTDPTWQFDLTALFYESDFDSAAFDDSAPSGSVGAFSLIDVDNQAGTAKVRANKDALTAGKYKVAVKATGTWTGSKKDPNCSTCPNCGNCNNDTTTDVLFVVDECCKITSITADKDPVAVGTPVTFTATGPENACLEKIKWSNGGNPSTETGPTFTTTFTETGEKTVQAKCPTGEPETKTVTVVGVEKIEIDPESLPDCCPGYYFTSNLIKFVAVPKPDVPDFPDSPTWEMIEKPEESNVSISGDGKSATLTPDQPGTYKVKAKEGTSEALITVQVLQKPQVGLWGDTYAVEGEDGFSLLAGIPYDKGTLPCDIKIYYNLTLDNTEAADFDSFSLDALNTGFVTIPAGQRLSNVLAFSPVSDGADDPNPETFRISLQVPDEGCYELVPDRIGWLSDPLYPHAHLLEEKLTYSIYPCMAPFVIGEDDIVDEGNPGIDGSDVNQGRLPDCFCMATLGAIAESCPSIIQSHLTETLSGWAVSLYFQKRGESSRHLHTILIQYADLSDGPNMAAPTGDVDANGCAEIWPILYEQAINIAADQIAAMSGDPTPYGTSGIEGVFLMVTDREALQTIDLNDKSDQWIYDEIQQNSSRKMVLGTKPTLESWINVELGKMTPKRAVHGNHAYYVESIGNELVTLDNPWGEQEVQDRDVELPKMYLNNVFSTLIIFPDCD